MLLKLALLHEQAEDWEQALSAYEKASALDNQSIQAYGGIARILEQKEDYFRAIIAYRGFIELAPQNPYGYHRLGVILKKRGRNEEAEAMLKKAQTIYQQQDNQEGLAAIKEEL